MVECTGTYTLTQADIDDGEKNNTATASGKDPNEDPVEDTDDHTEPIPQNASIDVEKEGLLDLGTDGIANPGDVISYDFTVTNDGNVNLYDVTLTDPIVSIDCGDGTGNIGTLAPGALVECTGTYTLTQVDINDGEKNNTATATGTPPIGDDVTDTDDHTEPIPQNPAIDVEKYVSVDGGTTWEDADDPTGPFFICDKDPQFKFVVTNTGNVDLTGITLTDSDFDLSHCTVPPLAVGEWYNCTVTDTWVVVQHTDTANVTVDFGGDQYSDEDDANYNYRAPSSQ